MLLKIRNDYQELERVTDATGVRHYVEPGTGAHLPSVTTILSATADKSFLIEWEERVGTDKAKRAKDEATGLGTLMHEHLECHVKGIARPKGNNLIRQMAARMADVIINKGLGSVTEVWGMEVGLYMPGLYAGTTDLVGTWNGKPAIIDYKTAKRMRPRDQIGDYMDQMAAYGIAHDELYETKIDTGVILMVSRELEFSAYVVEGQEFEDRKASFLQRLETYMGVPEVAVC